MRQGWLIGVALLAFLDTEAQFKLYEQGLDAYQKKNYTESVALLNNYLDSQLRDKSLDVDVHYYLALSYFKTESHTSAVREFDEALQLGHKNAGNIHWFMAKSYTHLNALTDGVKEYTMALETITDQPNKSKLLYERALLRDKMGERSAALDDIRLASSGDPSNHNIKKTLNAWQGQVIATHTEVEKKPAVTEGRSLSKNEKSNSKPIPPPSDNTGSALVKSEQAPALVPPVTPAKSVENPIAEMFKNEKRYALVIGNSKYKHVSPLVNSENDANDMAAELKRSNFEVIKLINGDYFQMRDAFKSFNEKLANGPKDQTVGLFYYAGHGIQNEGENYLVPVEANIQYEDDIPRTCMPVQRIVMANMERSNSRMNILILDACRNNPFPSGFRSTDAGLAEIKRAKGSFIAYATAPGYVASDGDGRNGLYTQELLTAMKKPGLTIEQVFKEVRKNVLKLSGDKQSTWDSSNIIGDFYFKF